MAVWSFTERILQDKSIDLFDYGKPQRDFTFIDDIVEGIVRVMKKPPQPQQQKPTQANQQSTTTSTATGKYDANFDDDEEPEYDPGTSWAPFRVMNIGGSQPHSVLEFVSLLEEAIGKKAEKKLIEAQPGDVFKTQADTTRLTQITDGFVPKVSLADGLKKWAEWFVSYHK